MHTRPERCGLAANCSDDKLEPMVFRRWSSIQGHRIVIIIVSEHSEGRQASVAMLCSFQWAMNTRSSILRWLFNVWEAQAFKGDVNLVGLRLRLAATPLAAPRETEVVRHNFYTLQ